MIPTTYIPSPKEWAHHMHVQNEHIQNEQDKIHLLKKTLGLTPQEIIRPDINTLDIADIESIIYFCARHNLACAFGCCGEDTDVQRVEEIIHIIMGNIPIGKHIHITLYEDPQWEQIKQSNPLEALEYFQVWMHNTPQNIEKTQTLLNEFYKIYSSIHTV